MGLFQLSGKRIYPNERKLILQNKILQAAEILRLFFALNLLKFAL